METRDDRFAGYRRARLRVRDGRGRLLMEVRPDDTGATTGRFPFGVPAHVLTAENPGAERPGPRENERRQRALVAELPAGTHRWDAEAGADDGSHRERSVLVTGLSDEEAVALAARWGQDAIFRWTPEAWSVLPCDGGPASHTGWTLVSR
ncbi:DUF3293 domain-containing protein [Actinomycetospora atypica]|uniref:DUF3293 domain-containing protein n=1 Tax=Actinomycetospora atypica TaxID=1290095 RepID=A0ABV9YHZ7_9PSEU